MTAKLNKGLPTPPCPCQYVGVSCMINQTLHLLTDRQAGGAEPGKQRIKAICTGGVTEIIEGAFQLKHRDLARALLAGSPVMTSFSAALPCQTDSTLCGSTLYIMIQNRYGDHSNPEHNLGCGMLCLDPDLSIFGPPREIAGLANYVL